jgi:hypothetical protein
MIALKLRLIPVVLLATILSAQQVEVRINSRLSSESTPAGSAFQGVLVNAVQLNGQSCAKGSPVGGVVSVSTRSGRLSSPGVLELQPNWISCHGRRLKLSADPVRLEGRSHTKNNAVLIGGGAGFGAILGGLFGGGKGALIGTAAGAGAGTVGAAATGRHEAVIEPEAVIAWNLNSRPVVAGTPRQAPEQEPASRGDRAKSTLEYQQPATVSRWRHRDDDEEDDDHDEDRDSGPIRFSNHDRIYLQRCLVSNYRLPPGLAKQGKIPPGHAKKMQRDGDGEPIPYACTAELSPIPRGWDRVIVQDRVILIDPSHRQIDFFVWQN